MRRSPRDPPRSAEIRRDPPGEAEGSDRRDRGEIRCRSTLGSSRTGSEACCRTRARGPAGGGRAARPGAVVPHRVCVVCWCIGTDLYRMKGVLNVQHATQKFVYHAVHMIFNGAAPHISPYLAHDLQRCSSVRHRLRREMQPSHPRPPPLPPSLPPQASSRTGSRTSPARRSWCLAGESPGVALPLSLFTPRGVSRSSSARTSTPPPSRHAAVTV